MSLWPSGFRPLVWLVDIPTILSFFILVNLEQTFWFTGYLGSFLFFFISLLLFSSLISFQLNVGAKTNLQAVQSVVTNLEALKSSFLSPLYEEYVLRAASVLSFNLFKVDASNFGCLKLAEMEQYLGSYYNVKASIPPLLSNEGKFTGDVKTLEADAVATPFKSTNDLLSFVAFEAKLSLDVTTYGKALLQLSRFVVACCAMVCFCACLSVPPPLTVFFRFLP
jgi:hypothetical protein